MQTDIPLSDAPRLMRDAGSTVSYQKLWRAAIAGTIPAQRVKGRWYIAADDLQMIAQTLTDKE